MDQISLFVEITFCNLRTFIALKILFWSTFVSNGLLAQSVERGATNDKVMCSRLIRTMTFCLDLFK